jgi:hypothetical protein
MRDFDPGLKLELIYTAGEISAALQNDLMLCKEEGRMEKRGINLAEALSP